MMDIDEAGKGPQQQHDPKKAGNPPSPGSFLVLTLAEVETSWSVTVDYLDIPPTYEAFPGTGEPE